VLDGTLWSRPYLSRFALRTVSDYLTIAMIPVRQHRTAPRKKRLARLVGKRRLGIVLSDHTDEDGATIFQQACEMGLEGIVSKRLSAPYVA
jgi:bifunctional non-homologous end joining protein LigD